MVSIYGVHHPCSVVGTVEIGIVETLRGANTEFLNAIADGVKPVATFIGAW
jgi:hypothetical protein